MFERVRTGLRNDHLATEAEVMHRLARELVDSPFTHIVIDEAQDIPVTELHLVAALGRGSRNGLFFAGDIGQRIFRSAFPWKLAGVDIHL